MKDRLKDLQLAAYFLVGTCIGLGVIAASKCILAGDFPQDRHISDKSEWQLVDIAANNALRGKVIKSLADGALQGKTIKQIWATGETLTVEATDGSSFVYRFKPMVKVEPLDPVTLETTDGAKFEYRPQVEIKAQMLPRGKLVRPGN